MPFDPEQSLPQEEVNERVDEAIEDNEVVLFMKGNRLMPQCGYSKRALGLIAQHREDVETVEAIREEGGTPVACCVVVDKQGVEEIDGVPVYSLINVIRVGDE